MLFQACVERGPEIIQATTELWLMLILMLILKYHDATLSSQSSADIKGNSVCMMFHAY
jgi:hypothetical protein